MLRRVIIGAGALGLVLVVYGLYGSHNPAPAKPAAPIPTITIAPTSTAPAVPSRSMPGVRNIRLRPGWKGRVQGF